MTKLPRTMPMKVKIPQSETLAAKLPTFAKKKRGSMPPQFSGAPATVEPPAPGY
jgi:hypothetical protein